MIITSDNYKHRDPPSVMRFGGVRITIFMIDSKVRAGTFVAPVTYVVDSPGKVKWAYVSESAADRPSLVALAKAAVAVASGKEPLENYPGTFYNSTQLFLAFRCLRRVKSRFAIDFPPLG